MVNPDLPSKEVENDLLSLTDKALRVKYSLTYISWRNMKNRCKANGLHLDQGLFNFREFLVRLGPRQHKSYTLDRIDHTQGYTPENCRWADKKIQGINKGNVVCLTWNGKSLPLTVWAKRTAQKPDTLHKRKKLGWTDQEIVTGVRLKSKSVGGGPWPWPDETFENWHKLYKAEAYDGEGPFTFYRRKTREMRISLWGTIDRKYDPCTEHDPTPEPLKAQLARYEALEKDAYLKHQQRLAELGAVPEFKY